MSKRRPELRQIPVDYLVPGRYQPRKHFDPVGLGELAESIKTTDGLLQPIVVRSLSDNQYEIIAGERRWRAAQLAQIDTVSCLVGHYDDEQAMEATVIENISREDLNPIEEAQAFQRMMDDFGYVHEEIGATVGKSRAKISNALRLLKLDPRVQAFLIDGQLSEGHGKVLAGVSASLHWPLASACQKNGWSVRRLEREAKKQQASGREFKAGKDPDIRALEQKLSDHIGCPVQIDDLGGGGRLRVDFHNADILEGLFKKMGFHYE